MGGTYGAVAQYHQATDVATVLGVQYQQPATVDQAQPELHRRGGERSSPDEGGCWPQRINAKLDLLVYPSWDYPPRLIGDLNTPHGNNSPAFLRRSGFRR
jgi:hypothetical protein